MSAGIANFLLLLRHLHQKCHPMLQGDNGTTEKSFTIYNLPAANLLIIWLPTMWTGPLPKKKKETSFSKSECKSIFNFANLAPVLVLQEA